MAKQLLEDWEMLSEENVNFATAALTKRFVVSCDSF